MSIFDCTKCGKRYVTSVGFEKHKCITDIDIKVIIAERDRYKAERDALIYAIESSLDVYTRPEIIAAINKIKEG